MFYDVGKKKVKNSSFNVLLPEATENVFKHLVCSEKYSTVSSKTFSLIFLSGSFLIVYVETLNKFERTRYALFKCLLRFSAYDV